MNPEKPPYSEPGAPPPYPGQGGPDHQATAGYGMPQPSYPQGAYYPPPQAVPVGGYAPMAGTTTVLVTAPMMLGPMPVSMQCPKCGQQIVTETTAVAGSLTYLICVIIALLGGWLGCCMIPFCIDECQDVEHRCPNCKNFLGTYRRM